MGCCASNNAGVVPGPPARQRQEAKGVAASAHSVPGTVSGTPVGATTLESKQAAASSFPWGGKAQVDETPSCWADVAPNAPSHAAANGPCANMGGDLDSALAAVFSSGGSRPSSRGGGRPSSRGGGSRPSSAQQQARPGQPLSQPASRGVTPPSIGISGDSFVPPPPERLQTGMKQEYYISSDLDDVAEQSFSDAEATFECGADQDAAIQREFLRAAELLSEEELREFVEDHVNNEIKEIRKLPPEQRPQAFRSLSAEWHPDKCPAIAGLATGIFQRLQTQKSTVLSN